MGTLEVQPEMIRTFFAQFLEKKKKEKKKTAIFRDFCSLAYHLDRLSHNDLRYMRKHFTHA